MTNILLAILSSALFALFGLFIGVYLDNLQKQILDLKSRQDEKSPDLGATLGDYGPVNEFSRTNQDGIVGIVEAKTPQRVEWEAEESLRKEARGE